MKTKLLSLMTCFFLLGLPARADGDVNDNEGSQGDQNTPTSEALPPLKNGVWASYCPSTFARIPAKSNLFPISVYSATYNYQIHALVVREINASSGVNIGKRSTDPEPYGYLLKLSANDEEYHNYSVDIGEEYNPDVVISGLAGTITEILNIKQTYTPADEYLMVLLYEGNKFVPYTGDYFPAHKAYIVISKEEAQYAPDGAPSIRIIDASEVPTALNNCEEEAVVTKIVQNGQLLIVRDGVTFDLMGRTIR